ncbi:RNA-directed DNA polymerase from mobile element jockey [Rhizoctonia solani AG-1 IB]|uniref:RNA-directed DNA polymerase from mobile element jockey n=1 Tax=Thanatephorus cucumeris (strain AG1-IB / isolate 7/3/14) TaxID=1108050 RepID=M5BYE7_THACB|nr:RNA-directed DNA polymerase from mobile element jockey [Rhizoctonia solani AG-1 IB]
MAPNSSGIGARFSNVAPIHRDIIALDLTILDSQLTIINCYPHGTDHKKTVAEITQIVIPQDRPCIMVGDFNMHHPDWALIGSKWEKRHPNQTERVFATYAEYHDLHIMNNVHLPTHYIPRSPASNAIIDLTLLNSRAVDAWPDFNWEVETPASGRSLGSDHEAITWSVSPHDQAEPVLASEKAPGYPIDPSCQDDWIGFYAQQIHEADLPEDPETAEDADRITGGILSAMSNATRLTFEENQKRKLAEHNKNYKGKKPKKKGNTGARSPWWTEECSQAVHNLKHNPENKDKDQLRGALRGAIRRARKSRGEKILAEISTDRVFDCLKWFQGKRRALIPPIKDPNGGITATHPADKAKNFGKQFFPSINRTPVSLEPLGIKSTPKRPHHYITEEEISRSLSKTSNRSAPGAFGSNYRLLKWAFASSPDHFVSLFNLCLRIGYHPTSLRNCIIAPIPKPRRQDMSIPKNYRPIALLETLSKLLEKVITNRITHEAGKHNLLSHSQFGGKDITSCTDAGLCMIHDIQSAWARKKNVSLLTLDISGYFNNVNHERLIYTMDRLGFSNEICNWLKSYLSHRSAQFRIDGTLCNPIQLPNVGIPQGSPLSPILSSIYSLPILASTADLQASSFGYIDDFTILAFSDSHEHNINIIQDITNNVNEIAIKLGLEFELPKSELIHFIRSPRSPHSNPSLTISSNGTDTTIHPQECIRWLGFYLDRKLTFKEHIANMAVKARAALGGLRMLANSRSGLSIRHARILYKACITPILIYGLPLWFHGRRQKSLLEPLRKTQNLGLRWILGAFRTTPVRCMEHLASIPPIHILCQKHIESLAAKLRSIPRASELAKRLPSSWDSSTLPSRNNTTPKDPIHLIASHSDPNAELVTPYLAEPHLPTKPFGDQLVIEAMNPNPNSSAGEFIDKCKNFASKIQSCPQSIIGYSDGHADETDGKPECSIGFTIWTHNREIHSETKNIGPRSNIYDAEMLGIALCLRRATNIAIQNGLSNVYICCDNQSAVKSICKLDRHPAQYASRIFRNHASTFLTDHPTRKITIKWIPGHKGIGHNGRADELAKEGARGPNTSPFDRTITWIKQAATKNASTSWAKIWEKHIIDRENSDTFIPRAPSLTLHPIFNRSRTARSLECRLVQLLTGHCFLGEYRTRFHPDLDPSCQCGESTQTFIHTTLFCPSTEGHRAILRLEAVVEFIAKSGIGKLGGPPAAAPDL